MDVDEETSYLLLLLHISLSLYGLLDMTQNVGATIRRGINMSVW